MIMGGIVDVREWEKYERDGNIKIRENQNEKENLP